MNRLLLRNQKKKNQGLQQRVDIKKEKWIIINLNTDSFLFLIPTNGLCHEAKLIRDQRCCDLNMMAAHCPFHSPPPVREVAPDAS